MYGEHTILLKLGSNIFNTSISHQPAPHPPIVVVVVFVDTDTIKMSVHAWFAREIIA